jgi:hypothetical protein
MRLGEFAHCCLAMEQALDDPPARLVGQRPEHPVERLRVGHHGEADQECMPMGSGCRMLTRFCSVS